MYFLKIFYINCIQKSFTNYEHNFVITLQSFIEKYFQHIVAYMRTKVIKSNIPLT